MKPYKLMSSLFAHSGDVKSICATRDKNGFVSVSRDLTAKLWFNNDKSNQYSLAQTINVHKKYVNAVVVVYTVEGYPNGLIITGSNDLTIAIHDIESNKFITQLQEHNGPVCSLYFDNHSNNNLLYSGSFDRTAKVWNLNNLVSSDFKLSSSFTLPGHDQTVWSVLGIEKQGILLTGSADKTIKHWQLNSSKTEAECICKYTGHTDCVRGLSLSSFNDQEFFSCSNDGCAIQWRLGQTTPLRTIRITDSFLYSINMIYTDDVSAAYFTTSGEDRTLRIHCVSNNQADIRQSIALPAQSLWYAVCLPNGNIAVACSDGSVRLFTQNESLMATKAEQEEYEKELAQFTIPLKANEEMSKINRNELPGVEALSIPGRKDGQPLLINNNDETEVYQWDGGEQKWIKIGVAVGSSGAGGGSGSKQKVTYLGKEYDFVFDIELDDVGGKKLKLPYNLSDNPYHAAQKFIHENELSQYFLDEIAQFIIKNTQSETIGVSSQTSSYYDPFTGENRYVPPASSGSSMGSSNKSNYVADPFTGSGAYHTGINKTQSEPNTNQHFPQSEFCLFDQLNSQPIIKKLREFQEKLASSYSDELIKESSNIELIENLLNTQNDKNADLNDQIELLFQMIDVWPEANVFPLIDLTRILTLNERFVTFLFKNQSLDYLSTKQTQPNQNYYFSILYKFLKPENPINTMLIVKVFCNLFKFLTNLKSNEKLLSFVLNERSFLFKKLESCMKSENKSFQNSFATLLLNYSILIMSLQSYSQRFTIEFVNELTLPLIEYLNDTNLCDAVLNWDAEAVYRMLVSYGTIVSKVRNNPNSEYLVAIASSLENFKILCKSIQLLGDKFPEKVQKCASSLTKLIE